MDDGPIDQQLLSMLVFCRDSTTAAIGMWTACRRLVRHWSQLQASWSVLKNCKTAPAGQRRKQMRCVGCWQRSTGWWWTQGVAGGRQRMITD